MPVRKKLPKPATIEEAMEKYPHLKRYIADFTKSRTPPVYYLELDRGMKSMEEINLLYPLGGPSFIHVTRDEKG